MLIKSNTAFAKTVAKCSAISFSILLLASCETTSVEPFSEPLRAPSFGLADKEQNSFDESTKGKKKDAVYEQSPVAKITQFRSTGRDSNLGADLKGKPISVTFNDVPLVVFINEVFGNELNLSFFISPSLQKGSDLVTLRLTEPLTPSQLFKTSSDVLKEYGIGIEDRAGILTFVPREDVATKDVPLLVSGRASLEVPNNNRVIFQFVPLKVVRNGEVTSWLKEAMGRGSLQIMEDPSRNSILLKGTPELVAQAIDMIGVLDQPFMKGQHSMIVSPLYIDAVELSSQLTKVLSAEGYSPGNSVNGSPTIIPLESANKLLIFSSDSGSLSHFKDWIKVLDEEQLGSVEDGFFTYEVLNTQAGVMVETLNSIMSGSQSRKTSPNGNSGNLARNTGGGVGQSTSSNTSSAIVVDENSNTLIFKGAGDEWKQLVKVMKLLDRPTPSVLIEVIIAEITLTNEQGSGVEFLFNGGAGRFGSSGGTLDKLGLSGKGLSLTLDSAGATRAALNLFYDDSRVVIRSTPKLLVKSGETASIEVGNEIPVISQISTDATQTDGNTNILQQVSYRKTGISLEIQPIVQANGLVDLDISQSLSEARPTASTSLVGSPTILNRKIKTSLTLRDGGSLLMGGLVSDTQSSGQNGIPGLAKIPGLGRLFKNTAKQGDKTELIIMVIPYVIRNHQEGWELTNLIKEKLELHHKTARKP